MHRMSPTAVNLVIISVSGQHSNDIRRMNMNMGQWWNETDREKQSVQDTVAVHTTDLF
jgi:hypothetical protein